MISPVLGLGSEVLGLQSQVFVSSLKSHFGLKSWVSGLGSQILGCGVHGQGPALQARQGGPSNLGQEYSKTCGLAVVSLDKKIRLLLVRGLSEMYFY